MKKENNNSLTEDEKLFIDLIRETISLGLFIIVYLMIAIIIIA